MASSSPTIFSPDTASPKDTPSERLYLDARGYRCPLPVLKTRKRLALIADGETLIVVANDPAVYLDMTHFCLSNGHFLESWQKDGEDYTFSIRKGSLGDKGGPA